MKRKGGPQPKWLGALVALLLLLPTPVSAASVPSNLTPSLEMARADLAVTYASGCHVAPPDIFRTCHFGNATSPVRIALFGDSHAASWFPALVKAVRSEGWRLDNYTRGACPSVGVHTILHGSPNVDCDVFHQAAIDDMNAHPPTLIVLTNRGDYPLSDPGDYEATWDAALTATLDALDAPVMVLEDTPLANPMNIPICLQSHMHNVRACEKSPSHWIHATHNANERATAIAAGDTFGSLNAAVCPGNPCPVIAGRILMYRDGSHLTATYARSLWQAMDALLQP